MGMMEKQGSGIPTDCCVGVQCVCLGEWDTEFSPHTSPPSLPLWLHRDLHPCDPGNTLESPSHRVSSGLSSLEVDLPNLARSAP